MLLLMATTSFNLLSANPTKWSNTLMNGQKPAEFKVNRQISLLIFSEFERITYSPRNYRKTHGFLIISWGSRSRGCLILSNSHIVETKFGNEPLMTVLTSS